MTQKIVVLGAGMVGRAMARDLSTDYHVLSVDRDQEALSKLQGVEGLSTQQGDLQDNSLIKDLIKTADLVVGAVPGFMGFQTLKTVIGAGKNIVDISFFPEDPFELDALAKKHDVIAVVDAGVAPGMSNIILGYHDSKMEVSDFTCYVGGLPLEKLWPYEYKAPFSPIDVIEEYIRPSRLVENGGVVEKPALSEPELIDFPAVGTLEAFNTDGLRSLIKTMNIPNMKEKTLRYPGHIELMRVLRETGFFDYDEVKIGDQNIRPIDLTTHLLFPKWKLEDTDEEFTIMQVDVEGVKDEQHVRYSYHLLDKYNKETKTSSMARTTGYTCTAISRLVLEGQYGRKGISPPEFVGATGNCFKKIIDDLAKRNVNYKTEKKSLSRADNAS